MGAFIHDLITYSPQILVGLLNTVLLMIIMSVTGLAGGVGVFYLTLSKNIIIA